VGQDGLVYVADTWNHRVVVLSSDGELIREIGGPPDADGVRVAADTTDDPAAVETKTGQFFGPRAVAVSHDELYVVDTGNERVQVFGIDGTFKRVWGGYGHGPGQLIEPGGIAIGPDGLIYVADAGNARVSIFTPGGEPIGQWPVKAWPAPDAAGARPGFQPYLAFDQDGKLYVSSSETGSVEVLDRAGALVRSIDKVGADKLQQPVGVGAAPNGDILITDLAASAVYRYTPPTAPPLANIVARLASPTGTTPAAGEAIPTSGSVPPPPG
jgi:sugar lactone lactonase YvrE